MTREVPRDKATIEDPNLLHHRPVKFRDRTLISDLSTRLHKDGILGEESSTVMGSPEARFEELFAEAAAAGKSEEELNPDFYRPEVEAIVAQRERERRDWENPDIESSPSDYFDEIVRRNRETEVQSPKISRGGESV